MVTRCAVLGRPIAHSLSPVLHAAAYDALGLTGWSYEAVEVDEAGLPDLLRGLDEDWRGLSLTMPLKRQVLGLLDSVSPVAEQAGAVNTVLLGDGLRVGDNTDVPGVVAAVRERYAGPVRSAVVVGGGATAASVLVALGDLGTELVTLLVRDESRAEQAVQVAVRRGAPVVTLAALTGGPPVGDLLSADLVVSTIPAGAQTPDLVARLAAVPVVFDVTYDPWPTPLSVSVGDPDRTGRTLVTGLDLLVHQAVRQVALMTDVEVELCLAALPAMRAAGERALASRAPDAR